MQSVSLNLLYEALGTDLGVVILTNDAEKARQKLYKLRAEANDPDLESLSIVQSPTAPNQLWIVKRKSDAPK